MESTITIRPATHKDLLSVAMLAGKLVRLHHAFDPLRYFVTDDVEGAYRAWFGKELGRAAVVLLVAESEGEIVGYVYGRLEGRDWNQLLDACGAIHDLWVEERVRRGGVARLLIGAAIDELEAKGAPRVVLHTAVQNTTAQQLFEQLGFRRTMVEMTRERG
jgi:ribosomal protein S18 acetylase RimI-like enzyme